MTTDKRMLERQIFPSESVLNTLKIMDNLGLKSLIIIGENDCFEGIVSIGDIQRAIINNIPLDKPISNILRPNPNVLYSDRNANEVRNTMLKHRMEFLPVVDSETRFVSKIYFWEDIFQDEIIAPARQFDLPVIIMAGGKGTRLRPLTNVIPKPLVPVGEKTMLEHIFDRFHRYGCKTFHISVNYKADLIEFYLKQQNLPYNLFFFREQEPLGTVGSLALLKGKINETFFVSNCDILIEQDYSEILDFHKEHKNEITLVAALKHYPIPYGTLETGEGGKLLSLHEKPELTFKINSGMYILEPHLIDEIPGNKFFHITQLIERVLKRGGNVGVFPVSEKSWKDVGEAHLLKQYFNAG
jgi:dTDP-glucose pyrophosphorylase